MNHAVISTSDKRRVLRLGKSLLDLGNWELNSYGATKQTLEAKLPAPEGTDRADIIAAGSGLHVSDMSCFIGEYEETDRADLSARLITHMGYTSAELAAKQLPSIDLLYMNPLPERTDEHYEAMVQAAIDSGRIVVLTIGTQINPFLEWQRLGRPEGHDVSMVSLAAAARAEIECYAARPVGEAEK